MAGRRSSRREFSRKVRRDALDRADGPVFMVQCAHCAKEFDRGYKISATRAANPQYCSAECRGAEYRLRSEAALAISFWERTERQPNGCLHWTGRLDPSGYGRIDFEGKPRLAHRIAHRLAYGEDPGDQFVCHSCDNPTCVEPKHLWLGSQADNMSDASAKGRLNSFRGVGSQVGTAKITEDQAREIKFGSEPAVAVAARFGVTKEAIYAIRNSTNWGWLK